MAMKRKKGDAVVENRIIAHVDLDCFYVQVERSHNAALMNKPVGVVQYNPFGDLKSYGIEDHRIVNSGSLIAVSYEARAKGVKRSMRGAEAKKACPEMILVQVPTSHGKADLTIYRDASARILTVLASKFTSCIVERASIDEVYLDVSVEAAKWLEQADSSTFLANAIDTLLAVPSMIAGDDTVEVTMSRRQISKGHTGTDLLAASYNTADPNKDTAASNGEVQKVTISSWFARPAHTWSTEDKLLLCGALVVNELRKAVYDELGFTCSAGVANNKILAKLSSAMHKPNKQTLAPACVIPTLMKDLPYSRIQGLGGKLGTAIESIYGDKVRTMGQILAVPRGELAGHFGEETAQWLHAVSQGIDHEPVVDRALPISIGCSKSFRSTMMLTPQHLADGTVLHWLTELAGELQERLTADTKVNSRIARNLHAGASVKIFVTNGTALSNNGNNGADSNGEAIPTHNPDAGGGWEEWHDGRGFSLSKICPLVLSGSTATMARTSLQMLTKAIFEHPKYVAAFGGNGAAMYTNGGSNVTNGSNGGGESAGDKVPASPDHSRHSAASATSPAPADPARKTAAGAPLLWAITGLSMGATNFQTIESGANSIKSYFKMPATIKADSSTSAGAAEDSGSATEGETQSVLPEQPLVSSVAAPAVKAETGSGLPKEATKSRDMFAKQREAASSAPVRSAPESAATTAAAPGSLKRAFKDTTAAAVDPVPDKKPRSIRDAFQKQVPRQAGKEVASTPQHHISTTTTVAAAAAIGESSIRHWVARRGTPDVEILSSVSKLSRTNSLQVEEVGSQGRAPPSQGHTEIIVLDSDSSDEVKAAEDACLSDDMDESVQFIEAQLVQDDCAQSNVAAFGHEPTVHHDIAAASDVPQRALSSSSRSHAPKSMQDIDSAVFLTLPPDVQREIELTMRLRQQTNTNRAAFNKIHTKPATSSNSANSNGVNGSRGAARSASNSERDPVNRQPESMQEVDSAVFLSLPPDIQREIELTMRLRQQRRAIDSSLFLNDEKSSIGKCKR